MDLQLIFKEVRSYNTIYNSSVEQAIDLEVALPDYCPDVKKIYKCNIHPSIHNIDVNSGVAKIDGVAKICIIYQSGDKNEIREFESQTDFTKSVDLKCSDAKTLLKCKPSVAYVNCRAINERKFDIHGAVALNISCVCENHYDAVCDVENNDIQLRKEPVRYSELVANQSKLIILNEEIPLKDKTSSCLNIICCKGVIQNEEYKAVANKIVYKASLFAKFTYLNEDGYYENYKFELPINQIIEVPDLPENAECKVHSKLCNIDLKPQTDRNGNCMSVLANAKISVDIEAWKDCDIEIVNDLYSTECEVSKERIPLELMRAFDDIKFTESVKQTLDFVEDFGEIICVDYDEPKVKCENNDENAIFNVDLPIKIYYLNTSNEYCCIDKTMNFQFERVLSNICNKLDFELCVTNAECTTNSDDCLEVRCEFEIIISPFFVKKFDIFSNLSKDESKPINKELPAIVLYFAKSGESVWDIAMRYNTTVNNIMSQNALTNDILTSDKMLIIPGIA